MATHTGKIKKIVHDRGFGFISDVDGRELFFHQSGLLDVRLEELKEGQKVSFEVEQSPKGPRAVKIQIQAE